MELYKKYMEQFPEQTQGVVNAEAQGRFSHSYLIYSDSETVREEFSILLAKIAACPNSLNSGIPCEQCSICNQLDKKVYSEYIELMPNTKSRAIAIGDTSDDVGTMRWFQEKFYVTSLGLGRRKIGVLTDVECLTLGAQNAFLKTLEEPPTGTVFILNTGNPQALLNTISSRSHTLTLLVNKTDYNFKGSSDMIYALAQLHSCSHNHLYIGNSVAEKLINIMSNLNKDAESFIFPKWKSKLDSINNKDSSLTKVQKNIIKRQYDAAKAAEYKKRRTLFLSLIHIWFSQIYQLSCGIDISILPNPELMNQVDISLSIKNENKAYEHLLKVEKLIEKFNWNINEELAIREFCCSFTC